MLSLFTFPWLDAIERIEMKLDAWTTSLTHIEAKLDSIINQQTIISSQGVNIMANIADVKVAVENENTVIDSAIALLNNLSQMLKDALAANDPMAVQAVINQIDSHKIDLANAVAANTPPVMPPGP